MEGSSQRKPIDAARCCAGGKEYLALDVVAFEPAGDRRWRFPIAAVELENSTEHDRVAYSLWKVLCTRASHRVLLSAGAG